MTGPRKMRFKPSLKQTVSDHEKAIRWMCNMAGKPIPAEFAERAPEPAKQPRKPPTPTDKSQLEAAVQREVFSVLAKHPAVLFGQEYVLHQRTKFVRIQLVVALGQCVEPEQGIGGDIDDPDQR